MATGDRFQPSGQHELGPAGKISRITANLEAIRVLRVIGEEDRPATPGEQALLARWSGWGAVPQIFDERKDEYAGHRAQLRDVLSDDEYAAARRTTLNAHYTDAAVVQAVWDAVAGLGFDGGTVLEPGCGSGNFIGFAPPSARMLGVELDPVTAGIAAALYPDAEIRCESFADTRIREGGFDLVIGNVPFSNAILADGRHNAGRYSMHNHFILKSLEAVRPGGLVAVLTSRYSMDAISGNARSDMAGRADLVTAIRLPSGAHRRAAGTDAVTDLLILRRREEGRPPAAAGWLQAVESEFEGGTARVNEYFLAHPENVIGDLTVGGGQYNGEELIVQPRDLTQVPDDLAARLAIAVSDAHEHGLAVSPRASWHTAAEVRSGGGQVRLGIPARDASRFEGTITAHGDGTFTVLRDRQSEPWPCPDSQAAELRALLRLRDTVSSLLDAERASSQDTPRLDELRQRLNREYDAYAAAYGPLNRTSWRRTGRTDEDGNDTWARQAPGQGKFKVDPYAATVYALESFDLETGVALKAPIFTQRVIADRQPAESAGSPADAIAICMDADGQVRLERAARLLGSASPEEARAALGELVYDEPETGRLVPAAEYLSGKVRDKLAAAGKAAETDPKFTVNVTALRKVLPADLGPGEIDARLGASWIPPEYVQQGLREILQDRTVTVVKGYGSSWQVKGNTHSLEARDVYGTADKDAIALAQCLLELRPIKVSYSMDDLTPAEKERLSSARGREDMAAFMRQRAAAATVAARGKADELSDRFSEWLWEDKTRTAELTRTYNEKFNSLVLRSYDDARPRLPGLAEWFNPHPHQYAAVARIVNEPAALLAHEVGAGKTAEMAMGCMELRRLGLVSKPAIIVPNHMLEQFQREFLQLYPQARVLACGAKDLQKDRRRTFVARIATGDWDAVIMSRSVFERIPMSAAEQERYIKAKLVSYDRWLERAAAESEDTRMVKRMEKQRLSFEERLKRKLSRARDAGISWEQTGIDYLLVDEAHGYKNLDTRSNSPSLDIDGSGRAADLEMKLDCLRRENGQRIVTFATATPIANSMTEAYVMLSYLRPDLLKDAGIDDFDGWAGSFTSTSTDVEVAPEGGLRVRERVSRFRNLPELLLMWRVVADVKTAEDLSLPVPDLTGGKPEVVTVPPSSELRSFMMTLASRAESVRTGKVEPREDNMLKISSDGRAAALDLRLAGLDPPAEEGKLDIAAGRIARIYRETKDSTYSGRDGNPEPGTGSLQIVFCELGTPTGSGKFGVYEYLKAQLADRGIPAAQVRFMHEAKNDKEKAALFAAARAGKISVLLGTTELMGVGTNVQKRAVALHHLDCPWRPADVAQREGRILRQGNQNPQVQVIRYVTEGSFDAYMWQTVLRKAKFIAQVMHGRLDSREIEDIGGSEALSYSEVTALATGDMRILLKAKADAEVQRLIKLETSWKRSKRHLKTRIADGQRDIPRLQANVSRLEAAIGQRTPMKGDAFRCELNGKHLVKRADAAAELQSVMSREHQRAMARTRQERESALATRLGTFGGLRLEAKGGVDSFGTYVDLTFPDIGILNGSIRTRPEDSELGVVTKLENKLTGLDKLLADTQQQITGTEAEIVRARASLDAPFAKGAELNRARYESDRLAAELGGQPAPPPPEPEAHETPVADEADHDQDDGTSPEAEDTWAAADAEADFNENPLEEAGFTSDADEDEWDDEADTVSAGSAEDESQPAAPVSGENLAGQQREPLTAGAFVPAASSSASGHEPPAKATTAPALQGRDANATADTASQEAHPADDTAAREDDARARERSTPSPPTGKHAPDSASAEPAPASTNQPEREQATATAPPAASAGQQEEDSTVPVPSAAVPASPAASERAAEPDSPVSAAAPQPAPAPPAEPAPGGTSTIRIEHDDEGSRVYGTDKSQKPVVKALKDQGFKWSRKQDYWYLNRTWRHGTREERVRRLMAALNQLGIVPDSGAPQTPAPTQQTAEQPAEPAADRRPQEANAEPAPLAPGPDPKPGPATDDADTSASTSADSADPASTARPVPAAAGKSSGYEQDSLFGASGESTEKTAPTTARTSTEPGSESAAPAQPGSQPSVADSHPAGPATPVAGESREPASASGLPADEQPGESSAITAPYTREESTEIPASRQKTAAPASAHPEAAGQAQADFLSTLAEIPVDPLPYRAGRRQAESGSRIIESDYAGWLNTRQQPSDSRLPKEHPRVQQLIVRWKAVHAKGIADGPGPSAARYHALAHAALALATATDGSGHPRERDALSRLATDARKFSVRLRATAEDNFSSSDKAMMYRGGRQQAEKGSRMVEADFRAWSLTGAPPEAARDLNLWKQARRAELAWHAIRRSGLHDGPGPSAARYRELADATRELADGFSVSLPSRALLPLQQLADHARKHAIRLEATEHARTIPNDVSPRENGYGNGHPETGQDPYSTLPSELALVTRSAYAPQHPSPEHDAVPARANPSINTHFRHNGPNAQSGRD